MSRDRRPRLPSSPPIAWLGLLACLCLATPGIEASGTDTAPGEFQRQLEGLDRVATLVYVTAHPDDESGPIITYLARGLHARVVILCLTRGEGGQNLVGSELDEDLGWIRTEELERAAAGYGAEVRFLGAPDFGYSKSVEETLKIWDEQQIIAELVRQIRILRPLAVISNWSGTERDGGGAHHRAAGQLARQAFALAGREDAEPELLERDPRPWQPRYFLVRGGSEDEGALPVPVEQPSPVEGKTYEELGWEAFQNHRSQGIYLLQLSQLASRRRYFLRLEATLEDGPPAPQSVADLAPDLAALPDLFPSVPLLAEERKRFEESVALIVQAREQWREQKTADAALSLVQAAALLAATRREFPEEPLGREGDSVRAWLDDRTQVLLAAAATLAGVQFTATTDRGTYTPGEQMWIRLSVRVGNPEVFQAAGFRFGSLRLEGPEWPTEPVTAETTPIEQRVEYLQTIPEKVDPARTNTPFLRARAQLTNGSLTLELKQPVVGPILATAESSTGRFAFLTRLARRRGEADRANTEGALLPVSLAPAATLKLNPDLRLLAASAGEMTRDWSVELEAHRPELGKISAWLEVPVGWYTPLPKEVLLGPAGSNASLRFSLTVPGKIPPGHYPLEAEAGRSSDTYRLSRHRHLDADGWPVYSYTPARARLHILEIDVPQALRVGYIGFSDDPVPALLAQLGIAIDLLDETSLASTTLDPYDAVVVSNRMYDAREDLAGQNARLLEYARAGGTLLVEHQGRRWDPEQFAPFPGKKNSNQRVTDEAAPVRMLEADHPVLNFPNRIAEGDWRGWVQERGLYFWESWSEDYIALLEMADPGEGPERGALLYARTGEGVYIYCGLALFRQIRAGVPGGIRLYVNLLSQRRIAKNEAQKQETRRVQAPAL